jgi:putative ABC transport system permease protein
VVGRRPSAPGEDSANAADGDRGFGVGERLTVEPTGLVLTVVGRAADVGLNVTPTVYGGWDTYLAVAQTRNPGLRDLVPNALGVRAAPGVDARELAQRINAASGDLDALTAGDAASKNPGVISIRQSFGVIFALFAAVVPLVVGLFFLIITTQKAPSLTLLRAVGAPGGRLARSILLQVAVVLGTGLALATAAYGLLSRQRLDGLAIDFDWRAVAQWATVLAVLGGLSALASIRRVLAVDPIRAVENPGLR